MTARLIDDIDLAERVRELRAAGSTYDEIMAELHIGASTISRILGVYGKGRARPRVTDDLRGRARALRREGASVPEIARELGLARSTAWLITKDIAWTPGPDGASRRAEAERARIAGDIAESFGTLSERELMIAGAVAYWAEGAKAKPWDPRERLTFVNSDPDMIRMFVAWLSAVGVERERLRFRVSIHESADVPAAEAYWAEVVDVPVERFARATLKKHNPKTVRKNVGGTYRGCLTVQVIKSAPEYRVMVGLWSAIAQGASREAIP
ncbi:hypothetical protein [Jiangella gansuensis]|uniref:hypothetical protein n=1 Tax=Jiangella gansuensis TaxID=281473 RepID=UPI00047E77A4|nr:hypothetical protein [Jiangella gansuensis]